MITAIPVPRGRDWRHELHELTMALVGKHPRGAAVLLLGAEGSQNLKRQAPIGVDVTLDRLEPNRNNPRAHAPRPPRIAAGSGRGQAREPGGECVEHRVDDDHRDGDRHEER